MTTKTNTISILNARDKEIKLNEKQRKVVSFLNANKGKEFTLAEIGNAIGEEVKSGTTNCLITDSVLVCNKNARVVEKVVKVKVSTYSIGDIGDLETLDA